MDPATRIARFKNPGCRVRRRWTLWVGAIAEAYRAGRDEKDAHYLDISKSSMISVDQITALNPGKLSEWEAEVQRARDIVTQTEPGLRVELHFG